MIAFRHILSFLQPTFEKYGVGAAHRYRVQDSANLCLITDTATGALLRVHWVRCPGAGAWTAPALVLADEVASWPRWECRGHDLGSEDVGREDTRL